MTESEIKFNAWLESITFVAEDGAVMPVPVEVTEDPEAYND